MTWLRGLPLTSPEAFELSLSEDTPAHTSHVNVDLLVDSIHDGFLRCEGDWFLGLEYCVSAEPCGDTACR